MGVCGAEAITACDTEGTHQWRRVEVDERMKEGLNRTVFNNLNKCPLITLCKGVDRETNGEPQSRPATLLALTDVQHAPAEALVCHNWE